MSLFSVYPCHGQSSNAVEEGWKGLGSRNVENITPGSYIDIDQRLRCLQRELERITSNNNPSMKSCVLRGAPQQQYLTSALRLEVETEIDLLLRDQVRLVHVHVVIIDMVAGVM